MKVITVTDVQQAIRVPSPTPLIDEDFIAHAIVACGSILEALALARQLRRAAERLFDLELDALSRADKLTERVQ